MSGSIGYHLEIDQLSYVFNFAIDYTVDPYIDPQTGESFGDVTWSARYTPVGGESTWFSGYSSEANSVLLELGLEPGTGLKRYDLGFTAQNVFSGESVSANWTILSVALDTDPQMVAGTGGADIIIGGTGDDMLRGFDGNDLIEAGEGDDLLEGGAGSDRLIGALGDDIMVGGAGDDVYVLEGEDLVIERTGGGTDTVIATATYILPEQVEHLTFFGSSAASGTGNASANRLSGNSAANTLTGLAGNDTLLGGDGKDTLEGGEGDDSVEGGLGADSMVGGAGHDTYTVDHIGDRVIEANVAGIDTVTSSVTFNLAAQSIEKLTLTGSGNVNAIGNALANTLTGNGSNNVLNGGTGVDSMAGGGGNDIYVVDAALDRVVELGGGGADRVRSSVSYVLAAGQEIERLEVFDAASTTAANLIGNDYAASGFVQSLSGSAGRNGLNGKGGNDLISGLDGNDILTGGTGLDSFLFTTTPNSTTNLDVITDFSHADDTIRLTKLVFPNLAQGPGEFLGAGALADWSAANAAGNADDRILYRHLDSPDADTANDVIWFYYDPTGGARSDAVAFAKLTNQASVTLDASDFLVVL